MEKIKAEVNVQRMLCGNRNFTVITLYIYTLLFFSNLQ